MNQNLSIYMYTRNHLPETISETLRVRARVCVLISLRPLSD